MNKHSMLFILYCLITTIAIIGFIYLIHAQRQSRILIMTDDGQISAETKKTLQALLNSLMQETTDAQTIFNRLKQEVPTLEKVAINTFAPQFIKCKLSFDQPLLIVKREKMSSLLLSRQGIYTHPSIYRKNILDGSPSLLTHESLNDMQQKMIYQRIQKLPDNFFNDHVLDWLKATEIHMQIQGQPDYEYIIDAQTKVTPDMEKKLELVREKIEQKKNTLIQKKQKPGKSEAGLVGSKRWKIDIRYKDQIIVSPPILEKKGERKS